MIKLTNTTGREFRVLNLTDPQLTSGEWAPEARAGKILRYTMETLIDRVKPDLIIVSGDFCYAGDMESYKNYANYFDTFGIPWSCCFGNHDNQDGAEQICKVVEEFRKHSLFLYEPCDPALGNCNQVIAIEENGKIVEGIILMDTHDRLPYTAEDGKTEQVWAKLEPNQLEWYRARIAELEALGCHDTTLITHIPIYAYNDAWKAAFRGETDPKAVKPEASTGAAVWNPGYEDSEGVCYESICSYPADEGMFDVIRELGSTKTIVCGHDHVNNFMIRYQGVRFIYGLKIGMGCYWNEALNGGTVLSVTADGVCNVHHEFVDVKDLL